MKKLKLFENFTKDNIKNLLLKGEKENDIIIKTNIDDFLDKNLKPKEQFGFNAFVEEEGKFISEADYERMGEYIQKFKDLGLNTSKIEELYPKLQRYKHIEMKELDDLPYNSDYTRKEREQKEEELLTELDNLIPYVDELDKEVRNLAKQAKNKI